MKKRNYGIDFLRILSMFMVVMLHVLGKGGILKAAEEYSLNYYAAWFLEIASYCAVNCFAAISGYVMYASSTKGAKLMELWLQTVFYTVLITAVFYFLQPGTVGAKDLVNAFFPITTKHYWYISAYFGMYLLIPALNAALQHLSRAALERTLLGSFLLFSLLPTVFSTNPYGLGNGYSMIWLCLMYLVGGYICKYDIPHRIRPRTAGLIYGGLILFTLLFKIAAEQWLGLPQYGNWFIKYTSPTILFAGVMLLIACAGLSFPTAVNKGIALFSPAALGVYLIHVSSPVWNHVIAGLTKSFATFPLWKMLCCIFAAAVAIYLACTLIELCRIQLFKLCKIKTLCQYTAGRCGRLLQRKTTEGE